MEDLFDASVAYRKATFGDLDEGVDLDEWREIVAIIKKAVKRKDTQVCPEEEGYYHPLGRKKMTAGVRNALLRRNFTVYDGRKELDWGYAEIIAWRDVRI